MRIFNVEKTQELTSYDEELYYLVPEKLFIKHHKRVEEIPQKSHYEVVRTNIITGGVEYKEIIDIPYQAEKEAYDEYEDIYIAMPYTPKELAQIKYNKLINWFNTTYRYQNEKYNRLIILGKSDDDGISAEIKRKELYEKAEQIRKEIQQLEKELKDVT